VTSRRATYVPAQRHHQATEEEVWQQSAATGKKHKIVRAPLVAVAQLGLN